MITQWFPVLFGWCSLFLFVVLTAWRIRQFAAMPVNLRWEIYPVPHEAGDRSRYGGSYMEEVDWAAKPRRPCLFGELREMASEIIALKRVRKHNPYKLWFFALALHWGLYLLVVWLALLAVTRLLPMLSIGMVVVGILSFLLGTLGALGLIVRRAAQPDLRLHTTPADYANLALLAAIFLAVFVSWLGDPLFSQHQTYVGALLSIEPAPASPAVTLAFVLLGVLAIYMPLSRLIHPVMKHFTFTEISWNDAPARPGSATEKRLGAQRSQQVTWAAPHVLRGKTWLENSQVESPADGREEQ